MLFLCHVSNEDIQKGDKQEEQNIAAHKICFHRAYRKKSFDEGFQTKRFISRNQENQSDSNLVEHNFAKQLRKFPEGNAALAHKVSCYHDKTVYADFSPCPEKQQENRIARQRIGCNRAVLQRKP